jgi:hypothetical protein
MEDEQSLDKSQRKSGVENWTPNDSKLLVITVVATVSANVITIILIGLAIITARYFVRPLYTPRVNYYYIAATLIFVIIPGYAGAFTGVA